MIIKKNICTYSQLDPNKLANVRRYYIKINCLTEAEKDDFKEQTVADIQLNDNVALKMNAVNIQTDDSLEQSTHNSVKTPATENEYN